MGEVLILLGKLREEEFWVGVEVNQLNGCAENNVCFRVLTTPVLLRKIVIFRI